MQPEIVSHTPLRPAFKPGQLWRSSNPNHHGWACHGIFRIIESRNSLYAIDTYWGEDSISNTRCYPADDIATDLEFMIDSGECRVTRDREEYERYAESDRAYLPIGGGSERFYIRRSAAQSPTLVRIQLERKRDELARSIKWDQRQLAEVESQLAGMADAPEVSR